MPRIERKVIPPTPVPPKVEYVITLTEREAQELKFYLRDKEASKLTQFIYAYLPHW